MAATVRTITHTFENADGTPASGTLTFRLTKRITNGAMTYVPATITANLTGTGALLVSLLANDDPTSFPLDSRWVVTFRILGSDSEEFVITVPSAGTGPIDLGTLLPNARIIG